MSVLETVVTFFVVPTIMFVVISVLAYAMSKPRKAKTSSITTIE
jgi:large-conductance mechanosensitive channel